MPRASTSSPQRWPSVKSYDSAHLDRIAMPLGGIGTGTVSLGGRGDLRDWELQNRPAKHHRPHNTFFAVRVADGKRTVMRALEGPAPILDGQTGSTVPNHGLPRFRECTFDAAYPLAQVSLADPEVPLRVRLEAFNPLVPGDSEASGLPVAVIRYVLKNPTRRTLSVTVCGSVGNPIVVEPANAPDVGPGAGRVNEYRDDGVRGVLLKSEHPDVHDERWGSVALTTTAKAGLSHRTAWAARTWGDSLLEFWDDLEADGKLEPPDVPDTHNPTAALAVAMKLAPGAEKRVTFLLTWHFPNRMTWTPAPQPEPAEQGDAGSTLLPIASDCGCDDGSCGPAGASATASPRSVNWIGNYYSTQYADAWDAAVRIAPQLPKLEADTVTFVQAVADADLPDVVKEAALFNLSTLRSPTCFRTPDGHFFGWEGCHDGHGCCHGSCTHVWNYEHATAFLFPDLARSMREVAFLHSTNERGHMAFRVNLPLERGAEWGLAAADGQMGQIMKLHLDWKRSGDDDWLARLWPACKRAMQFCWIEGGWDGDRDGVMEGCQHNTMDVEYYGPNPQMQGWYLGALRACGAMARHLGDNAFADTCRDLFQRGSAWMDEHLFNGDYYEHHIRPPRDAASIAPGLRHDSMGSETLDEPVLQLGPGCLVDQLVGQYTADVCGLGDLHQPRHIRKTLGSILKHNGRRDLWGHFNHMRTYATNDDAALLMASYPRGGRPKRPFPYYNEVMTGFEYVVGVGLLQRGDVKRGLQVIQDIRDRYDGAKRNPFDEAECGHHYARAMAAWSAVAALSGFDFDATEQAMTFGEQAPATHFWSTGEAFGTARVRRTTRHTRVELRVAHGQLKLKQVHVRGVGTGTLDRRAAVKAGQAVSVNVREA